MEKMAALLSLFLMPACAGYPTTQPIAMKVVDAPDNCETIGRIASDAPPGTRKNRQHEVAVSIAKSLAAGSGANAIYFEETHSKLWGSTVLAQALVCQESDLAQMASFEHPQIR